MSHCNLIVDNCKHMNKSQCEAEKAIVSDCALFGVNFLLKLEILTKWNCKLRTGHHAGTEISLSVERSMAPRVNGQIY